MTLSFLGIHEAAQALLNCVCPSLGRLPVEVPGLDGCPCRVFVSPGAPAAEGCDEGCVQLPAGQYPGQLTVHVARTYPTDYQSFPRPVQNSTTRSPSEIRSLKNCSPPPTLAVELVVTLYRCTPVPTDNGCPPTPAALSESAMQLNADILAIEQGILCCFAATDTTRPNGRRYLLGQTQVLDPRGGCVGLEQRVTVALDDCMPCPVVAP
jgi:hypothetical protein